MSTQNLIGFDLQDLKDLCAEQKWPSFRAAQLFEWMYKMGVHTFDEMSNLPKDTRSYLTENFNLDRPKVKVAQRSTDGTQKWLIEFNDGQEAECVHIPERARGTLCISSQVGCTLTCSFCHTGTQKLVRNLTAGEIVGQIMLARDVFDEWPSPMGNRLVSNIVMMGMGEPLYNYDNVKKALKIIMDVKGIAFSRQKITLSTSGVVPQIEDCAKDLQVRLAISLHATRDELRNVLVPLNKKYPLDALMEVVRRYPMLSKTDRVTFEYVMLKDVNDTDADARGLLKLLNGIPAKVNLIPFNPWPGSNYSVSTKDRIQKFAKIIETGGFPAPIRTPRGHDILAACGQLKSESQRESKSKLIAA
jgi:23S rRNA (adenine2503-C2)-methyltransferase